MENTANTGVLYIEGLLSMIDNDVIGVNLKPRKLISLIRKAIKEIMLDVSMTRSYKNCYDTITVNGTYSCWEDVKTNIILIFHSDQKLIKFDKKGWDDIKTELALSILHEFRHDYQYSKRKQHIQRNVLAKEKDGIRGWCAIDLTVDGEYMAEPDELDAYAMHTCYYLRRFFSDEQINDILARILITGQFVPIINRYLLLFKPSSIVRKKFMRKVYKFLFE